MLTAEHIQFEAIVILKIYMWSSGLWHSFDWYLVTSVSEWIPDSIFRAER